MKSILVGKTHCKYNSSPIPKVSARVASPIIVVVVLLDPVPLPTNSSFIFSIPGSTGARGPTIPTETTLTLLSLSTTVTISLTTTTFL